MLRFVGHASQLQQKKFRFRSGQWNASNEGTIRESWVLTQKTAQTLLSTLCRVNLKIVLPD